MYDFYTMICAVFVASVVAGRVVFWLFAISLEIRPEGQNFWCRLKDGFFSLPHICFMPKNPTAAWRVSKIVRLAPFIPLRAAGFICAEIMVGPVRTIAYWVRSGWRKTVREPYIGGGGPMPVRIVDRDGYER